MTLRRFVVGLVLNRFGAAILALASLAALGIAARFAWAERAVYVPVAWKYASPTPCDYRRDPWGCLVGTIEAHQTTSPTPTSTLQRWRTATPTPKPERVLIPILRSRASAPGTICSAASVGGGLYYLAAHCLKDAPWRLVVDGEPVTAWAVDRIRDLAQVRAGAGGSPATLGALVPGEAIELRPARAILPARFAEDAWGRSVAGNYEVTTWQVPESWPVGIACASPGERVLIGDSGGGAHRAEGGQLGGIIVAAEAYPADGDVWCGTDQAVVIVRVP